eukprot:8524100-Alexandrium_andersonii.AAC.1
MLCPGPSAVQVQLIAQVLLQPLYSLPHGVIQLLGLQVTSEGVLQVAPSCVSTGRPNRELQLKGARELEGAHEGCATGRTKTELHCFVWSDGPI